MNRKLRVILGLILAIGTILTYATQQSKNAAPELPLPRIETEPQARPSEPPTPPRVEAPRIDTPAGRGDVQAPIFPDERTVRIAELPKEARTTLDLIDSNGPFPFDRDGITFKNREGLLMDKPVGYWREYTVITPGERTRGARRIVAGSKGERYYTDDHYQSFSRVVP